MVEPLLELSGDGVDHYYAVVQTTKPRRPRFPAGCVTLCGSEAEARGGADAGSNRRAAIVYGPSRSSEGVRIFYLVRWLE